MSLFQKGQPKTGGRRKGTRDRIATALLESSLPRTLKNSATRQSCLLADEKTRRIPAGRGFAAAEGIRDYRQSIERY